VPVAGTTQNSPAATSGCSWPSKPIASPPTPPAHRVANARPLSAVIGQPTPTTDSDIYIAHALINPAGIDPGHEIVVLANLATAPATLSGWTPIDRNDRAITVEASTPAPAAPR